MDEQLHLLDSALDPTIKMVESELCWAASIDMVARQQKIVVSQIKLRDCINQYLTNENTSHRYIQSTMPSNKKYFETLFLEEILGKIGCTQYQSSCFPPKEFIEKCISENSPIIFNGIFYPLFGISTLHTFVVQGYKNVDNKFWILTLDPRSTETTCKVAWVYNELINRHNKFQIANEKHVKMDFVTNFLPAQNKGFYANDFIPEPLQSYNTTGLKDELMVKQFAEIVASQKYSLLENYFGVSPEELELYGTNVNYKTRYCSFDEILSRTNTYGVTYYLPAQVNKQIKLEFIFFEEKENQLTFLGIQEPLGVQNILYIKVDGKQIKLNHEKPDYEIVTINANQKDYVFLQITINETTYFSPIYNYENLLVTNTYQEFELKNIFSSK
ncbi:hypothetical protein LV89_04443 [Arcicella aurantiaca]|uniref:Uncharacterized protein n=1 Tax=Arcicella aurantiaca TaxID=591202 RepID=A0A316DIK5_9BACT|nr:hypothetical protein [Arcicella aurantiaca]PWK17342.1 hypothetical protein LV89_04443 [Arcicella aurantiaca]